MTQGLSPHSILPEMLRPSRPWSSRKFMHVQKFPKEQMKVAGERISWPAVFFCVPDRGIGCRVGGPSWLAGRQEARTVCLWRAVEKEGEMCGCLYVQICWTSEPQKETKQMFACVCLTVLAFNIAELILKCSAQYLTMLRMFDLIHV